MLKLRQTNTCWEARSAQVHLFPLNSGQIHSIFNYAFNTSIEKTHRINYQNSMIPNGHAEIFVWFATSNQITNIVEHTTLGYQPEFPFELCEFLIIAMPSTTCSNGLSHRTASFQTIIGFVDVFFFYSLFCILDFDPTAHFEYWMVIKLVFLVKKCGCDKKQSACFPKPSLWILSMRRPLS